MTYQRVYNFNATYLEIEELLKGYFKANEWTYRIEYQTFNAFKGMLQISIQIEEMIDNVAVVLSYERGTMTPSEEQQSIETIGDIGDYLEGFFGPKKGESKPAAQEGGCPICGRSLRRKVIYCPNCGARVR